MERADLDLGFRPVINAQPNHLRAEHIEAFNARGYCAPFAVYDADEIARIRAYLDGLMSAMGDQGSYGVNCYQARLQGLYDIATDPKIVDLVADLIGPDVICWASAILSKKPHDPKKVPWHQDASFWGLSPARTVTVWLAVDDADEENAAMRFIPGSHAHGKLKIRKTGEDSVFHQETADAEALGAPVVNALRAGEISMHADMLVHGSTANGSDRRRCGLTLRYCPPEVRIVDPAWAHGVEAILCKGGDPSGHWRFHARPDHDDITKTDSPRNLGTN